MKTNKFKLCSRMGQAESIPLLFDILHAAVCLGLCLSLLVCVSLSLCLGLSLSAWVSLSLLGSLSLSLSAWVSLCLCLGLSLSLCLGLSLSLLGSLSLCLGLSLSPPLPRHFFSYFGLASHLSKLSLLCFIGPPLCKLCLLSCLWPTGYRVIASLPLLHL